MPLPSELPILPNELRKIKPEELIDPAIRQAIRRSITDRYYQQKPGDAGTFLVELNALVAQLPPQVVGGDLLADIETVRALVRFRQIALMTPEEIERYFSGRIGTLARDGQVELADEMPVAALLFEANTDLFLRWLGAAAAGIRSASELVGNVLITIYTGMRVQPTIGNWVVDYERYAANHSPVSNITIAEYLTKSPNVRGLTETDRAALTKVFTWFNIFRFADRPSGRVTDEEMPDRRKPVSQVLTPVTPLGTIRPQTTESIRKPVAPPSLPAFEARPTAKIRPPAVEVNIKSRLAFGLDLIRQCEEAERRLPPFNQESNRLLVDRCREAFAGGEAKAAVAGLFQVIRSNGLTALIDNPELVLLMRAAVQPVLERTYRLPAAVAQRAVDLPPNRMVLAKEFLKLLCTRLAGDSARAARLMVHIAGLAPASLAGPEATFAYLDLPSGEYRWAQTRVDENGSLRSEIG